jgi:hypothetical protein
MDHMQTRHNMTWAQKVHTERWYCDIGHESPEQFEFLEKSQLLDHLETKHGGQLTKSKLQGRARRNRRIATREPFVCPLCDCVPEDIKPQVHEKPYKQLSQHIGRHLKSLAFLSLSYMEDDSKDKQSLAESSHKTTGEGNSRLSKGSLKNRYLESVEDIPKTQTMPDGTRRIEGNEWPQEFPGEPPPPIEPEFWDFLPPKDLEIDFEMLKAHLQRRDSVSYTDFFLSDLSEADQRLEVLPDPRRYGITEVYRPPNGCEVDIVLVHGLGSNPEKTWTAKNGVFWPKDLLPAAIKSATARILVYGYKAYLSESSTIHQHAETLIHHLSMDRLNDHALENPIIWVAHSLGGLVVKKALELLNVPSRTPGDPIRSIFVSTYSIIFLGTPHTESKSKLSSILQTMAHTVAPKQRNVDLFKAFQTPSESAEDINSEFLSIIGRFRTCMVYENLETKFPTGNSGLVVDMSSASPQLPGVTCFGIEATHLDMCRYESRNSPGFRNVSLTINSWVKECPPIIKARWNVEKKVEARFEELVKRYVSFSFKFPNFPNFSGSKFNSTIHRRASLNLLSCFRTNAHVYTILIS